MNFLDVTLDILGDTYRPYSKPNNNISYVNRRSNHPPCVLKAIPEGVNKRLSLISANEDAFNNAKGPYQEALKASGYDHELKFIPETEVRGKRRRRGRNIIWYNPPYSRGVETNVGKIFLQIIKQCFPPGHSLHKPFNKNTCKLSYSCLTNIGARISGQNRQKLDKHHEASTPALIKKDCTCVRGAPCPLEGVCNRKDLVYKAAITNNSTKVKYTYFGQTSTTFKERLSTHKYSFTHIGAKNQTELSKLLWEFKSRGEPYNLEWKLVKFATSYKPGNKYCKLCISEINSILFFNDSESVLVNKREEFLNKCIHRLKWKIENT